MKPRYLCWFKIVVVSAVLSAGFEAVGQHCTVPEPLPVLAPTRVDYQNAQIRTDYHLLVLSWAPVFCAKQTGTPESQCLASAPSFVAAGLIPRSRFARREEDHPRHCIPPMNLSSALIRRNYCLNPSPQTMQDDWVRFGGCAFANAGEFFDRIAQLWSTIQKPDLPAIAGRSRSLTAGAIRQSFVAANSNIGLKPTNVIVSADASRQFSGVAICYDARFGLTDCPQSGASDRTRLKLR